MSKFCTNCIFSMDFLGDVWKDCSIKFSGLSIKEHRELIANQTKSKEAIQVIESSIKLLQDHFLEGSAYDSENKEIVKLVKEDLIELPSKILEKALLFLIGEIN